MAAIRQAIARRPLSWLSDSQYIFDRTSRIDSFDPSSQIGERASFGLQDLPPATNKSQSDGGDISVSDSAPKPKQICHFGDHQTTTSATRQCKGCNIEFSPNISKQSYCSNPCYQKNRPKKPPSAETFGNPINGAGKRNHDALSPVASLDLVEESSNKKAKADFDLVLADHDLTQLDNLDKDAMASKLESLLSFVYQQNDLVKHLEATVANFKTEMEHNKHAFADVIAKSYHAQPKDCFTVSTYPGHASSKQAILRIRHSRPTLPSTYSQLCRRGQTSRPRPYSHCGPVSGSRLGWASSAACETEG
ncbi:hypothetical protein DAPPUDRAFT_328433 [Daphnia pulex]|uniref:Uncharacterized protein n=1 Tax=Daphnia pulex TaxID=6669 RepID=E9HDP1_DAPPU|nr:hypothetical protein DAPPUDRAFT_328433 [Daphnia pulex]|eukprot:EFX70186.1 hypothetical protein DAPPUDRAFT_328433 [Daphnia pulex]